MREIHVSTNRLFAYGFLLICFVLLAFLFVGFFERLPLLAGWAIDWQAFSGAIQNGDIQYLPVDGLRPPPWSVLPLLPLGFVSMRAGWGLLTLITIILLAASVPNVPRRWLGLIFVCVSFPAVRVIVDGNFEGLIVGGILLMLHGYARRQPVTLAAGVLIATIKPQTVILLLVVLAIYVLRTWPRRLWLQCLLVLLVFVVSTMLWRGQEWLVAMFGSNFSRYTASAIDITLLSTLTRAGVTAALPRAVLWLGLLGVTLYLTVFTGTSEMTRDKAGLLAAASLLVAPYAAGNSLLVPFAIGVIPLFLRRPLWGLPLIVLVNAEFLVYNGSNVSWISNYVTFLIVLMWLSFGIMTYRASRAAQNRPLMDPLPPSETGAGAQTGP